MSDALLDFPGLSYYNSKMKTYVRSEIEEATGGGGGSADTILGFWYGEAATSVISDAFGCSGLTSTSHPLTLLFDKRIQRLEFPNVIEIGGRAFQLQQELSFASFQNCKIIGMYAFASCHKLRIATFPNAESVGQQAFTQCSSISHPIVLSNVSYIGAEAFDRCINLPTVNLSGSNLILSTSCFSECFSLQEVILNGVSSIGRGAFGSCYNLISLNLANVSSVPELNNTYSETFKSTPIGGYSASAGQYGSIYVPASLYSAFRAATNWTAYSSRMVSV